MVAKVLSRIFLDRDGHLHCKTMEKSMGYYFVAESSQGLESHTCQFFRFFCHVFRTTVWWDPDTLLSSWTRDVTTCPLYKGLCQLKQIFFHVWIFQTNVIQGALICLRDASFNLTDLYSLALFVYTFTLAKDPTAASLFKALQSKAIVEGQCGPYNESYLSCRFTLFFLSFCLLIFNICTCKLP